MISNILKINRQTEVILIILVAILVLSFDDSPAKLTSNLEELWKFNLDVAIKKNDTDLLFKYILTAVILVRTMSSRIFLGLYVILLWPTILEKKANIIMPWLILSFIRSVLINSIAFLTGIYICLTQKGCHPICLEFCIAQIIEHGPSFYAHYSIYEFYLTLHLQERNRSLNDAGKVGDDKYFHFMQAKFNSRVDDNRNVITESTITNLINHLATSRPTLVSSRSLDSLMDLESSKILSGNNAKFDSILDYVKKILKVGDADISKAKLDKSSRILPKLSSGMVLAEQVTSKERKKINLCSTEVELQCLSLNESLDLNYDNK